MNKSIIRDLLSLSFEIEHKKFIADDAYKQLSVLLKDDSQKNIRFILNSPSDFHQNVISKVLNKSFSKSVSTIKFLGKEYFCKGIVGTNQYFISFYDNTDQHVLMINAKNLSTLI